MFLRNVILAIILVTKPIKGGVISLYKDYNTQQTSFILNLDFDIPQTHIARLISIFVDTIPNNLIEEHTSREGRPAFHPAMLLKMILFAYSRKVFSGRRMVEMNEENIPMKWLSRDTSVSYKTLNNFRSSDSMSDLIKTSFVYFTKLLSENGMIQDEALFIDGTKVEADANKYSFTWKRAIDKFHPKLKEKITALYEDLIEANVVQAMSEEYVTTSDGVSMLLKQTRDEIAQLDVAIEKEPKVIKGGSENKRRRRHLKKLAHKMESDYQPRSKKYEDAEKLFAGRNSFSTTDTDATFMRMKEDPMLNGQLKPGYNLQAATNGQFILGYGIFPNPTDTRTLIPFLSNMHSMSLFKYIVADAGYGSESNYSALIDQFNKVPLIPYGMMEKEKKRKYKNDPTKIHNWQYNAEDDYYIDYQGVRFSFKRYSIRHDKYGFERKFKTYEADRVQLTAELDKLAKTQGGNQRQINYNPTWDYFKNQAKEHLTSEIGKRIYSHRKYDVEPVFGRMKAIFGVRRIHLRGKHSVENELGILLMSMNLTKLGKLLAHNGLINDREILFFVNIIQFTKIRTEIFKISVLIFVTTEFFPSHVGV